jgi:prepilin-type N-terminal cleavage/methylation domain-containing protein
MNFLKKAFTLAEVLITLAIVGIVAALTIPSLMIEYKANKLRTQFLKNYSLIKQSTKLMEENGEPIDLSNFDYKTLKKYFNVAVDCGTYAGTHVTKAPCYSLDTELPNTYKDYSGKTNSYSSYYGSGQYVLNDGTNMYFGSWLNHWIGLTVDVNGFTNPPNRMGYDTFYFYFSDGEWVYITDGKSCNVASLDYQNGSGCTIKAINDPNYFKWVVRNVK